MAKKRHPVQCHFCRADIIDNRLIRHHLAGCPLAPTVPPGHKLCLGCWRVKSLDGFSSKRSARSRDNKTSRCSECHNKQCLDRYHEPHNRLHRRFAMTKKLYGVSEADYSRKLAEQGGVCAICRRPPRPGDPKTDHLTVDHDHSGHKLARGLLCAYCNAGLGGFDDSVERLGAAIHYVKMWRYRHKKAAG